MVIETKLWIVLKIWSVCNKEVLLFISHGFIKIFWSFLVWKDKVLCITSTVVLFSITMLKGRALSKDSNVHIKRSACMNSFSIFQLVFAKDFRKEDLLKVFGLNWKDSIRGQKPHFCSFILKLQRHFKKGNPNQVLCLNIIMLVEHSSSLISYAC